MPKFPQEESLRRVRLEALASKTRIAAAFGFLHVRVLLKFSKKACKELHP